MNEVESRNEAAALHEVKPGQTRQRTSASPRWATPRPKRRRWNWLVWTVLIVLVLAAGVTALAYARRTRVPSYVSVSVVRGSVHETVDATGTISPVTTVIVGSQVSGTIARVHADFNAQVRQGDLLAEIEPRVYHGQVLQTEADLANAKANLATTAANLTSSNAKAEQARADYQRTAELGRQGLVSSQQLDSARATAESADAQVEANQSMRRQAEAQVAQREAALEVATANLAFTKVYAPVDGTVINRLVEPGQTLAAAFQTPTLFTIAQDLSKMQLHVSTAEGDVGHIHVGQLVAFRVDAFPGQTFTGRVSQIRMNATTVQNVVTYETIVDFDNPGRKLLPGMTAYATIPVASADDVVKVPNAALRYKPNLKREQLSALLGRYAIDVSDEADASGSSSSAESHAVRVDGTTAVVWKLRADQIEPVLIRPGITDRTFTAVAQVLKGALSPGDSLVTDEQKPAAGFGPPGPGGQ